MERCPSMYGQEGMMTRDLDNTTCACSDAIARLYAVIYPVRDGRHTHITCLGHAVDPIHTPPHAFFNGEPFASIRAVYERVRGQTLSDGRAGCQNDEVGLL